MCIVSIRVDLYGVCVYLYVHLVFKGHSMHLSAKQM